jgi:hypothetical protein
MQGNRRDMPPLSQGLLSGEVQSVRSVIHSCPRGGVTRDVTVLSTLHLDAIVNTEKHDWKTKELVMKSKYIVDYSSKLGAVDRTDMLMSCVQCIRKSVK